MKTKIILLSLFTFAVTYIHAQCDWNPVPQLNIIQPADCVAGDIGEATITGLTGSNYTYNWGLPSNPTNAKDTAKNIPGGAHRVTITNTTNGCQYRIGFVIGKTSASFNGSIDSYKAIDPTAFDSCNGVITYTISGTSGPYKVLARRKDNQYTSIYGVAKLYDFSPVYSGKNADSLLCRGDYQISLFDKNGCSGNGLPLEVWVGGLGSITTYFSGDCSQPSCSFHVSVVTDGSGQPPLTFRFYSYKQKLTYLGGTILSNICAGDTIICMGNDAAGRSFTGSSQFIPVCKNDSVWPGDANHDGIANNVDVLSLGQAWGDYGFARKNASINWKAQASDDWSMAHGGINDKHADTDGNDVVGFSDTTAILLNYGQMHAKKLPENAAGINDPTLVVDFPKGNYSDGTVIKIPIRLGTNSIGINNFYGLAFTVNYPSVGFDVSKMSVDFSNSWLGKRNVDMIGISKNFPASYQVDIGVSRINYTGLYGNGTICELTVVVDNLGGITGLKMADLLQYFKLSKVTVIGAYGEKIPVNLQNDSVLVKGIGTAVKNIDLEKSVGIYPNPASDNFTVTSPVNIRSLELIDVVGRIVYAAADNNSVQKINVSQLDAGIYTIRLITDEGVVNRRVSIKR